MSNSEAVVHSEVNETSNGNGVTPSSNIKYVVARVALNMRTGPSTDFEVIKSLRRGTAVEVLEEGPWSKIRENGDVGYVSRNFLSVRKPGAVSNGNTSSRSFRLLQTGMNINPDAHGLDLGELQGLQWVRFVYKAAAKNRDVDQAFRDQYQQLIQAYTAAGIKCLIILNQETVWENEPWEKDPSDPNLLNDWRTYAGQFGQVTKRVAELCKPFGNMVAYQIWNEEDSPPSNDSAIGVAPDYFALVLDRAASAIRQVSTESPIVIGGLNSGPGNAVAYVRRIQAKLGGRLPVDALAYHPYGRYVQTDPFYSKKFGTLQDGLRVFKQAFPNKPLWITEIGVADDNPIGSEHYEKIATYMREFVEELASNHTRHVPVLIWFAWTDLMRNAGIKTVDGRMKPHIEDAFREMVARGQTT